MSTILALALFAAAVWLWLDSMRARERAVDVARRYCARQDLQFLDDTVALAALRPRRTGRGLRLQRVYEFEFSDTGLSRHRGAATVLGSEVIALHLGAGDAVPSVSEPRNKIEKP
jgi:hypothetical protein